MGFSNKPLDSPRDRSQFLAVPATRAITVLGRAFDQDGQQYLRRRCRPCPHQTLERRGAQHRFDKALVNTSLRTHRPGRQSPARRNERHAAFSLMPLTIVGIAFQPAAVLSGSSLPIRFQLIHKVCTHRPAPRHLQRQGRDLIGNILCASESRLENNVIIADVHNALRDIELPGARRRKGQLRKLPPVRKRRSVRSRKRHRSAVGGRPSASSEV